MQYSEEQGSPLGYEPVNFKDGKLHSVSLVSDVISNNSRMGGGGRTHYEGSHVIARKQNSNSSGGSSVAGGGSNRPPPPYKQPPNIGNGNKIQQPQPSDYIQNSKRRPSPTTTPSRSEHHEQEVRNCHNHHYQNVSGLYANLVPNRDRGRDGSRLFWTFSTYCDQVVCTSYAHLLNRVEDSFFFLRPVTLFWERGGQN